MSVERVVSAVLGSHRMGFTIGTALLGVGGSLVATDARSVANWCLFVGAGMLMYIEDRFADGDRDAHTLAKASSKPLSAIRLDVFRDRRPVVQTMILAVAITLMMGWGALRIAQTDHHPESERAAQKAR